MLTCCHPVPMPVKCPLDGDGTVSLSITLGVRGGKNGHCSYNSFVFWYYPGAPLNHQVVCCRIWQLICILDSVCGYAEILAHVEFQKALSIFLGTKISFGKIRYFYSIFLQYSENLGDCGCAQAAAEIVFCLSTQIWTSATIFLRCCFVGLGLLNLGPWDTGVQVFLSPQF